ncbi:D-alanyl-D-alanine carboxypeptidase family protein [Bacillus sp. 03113]|uniref:D-alanyl-D-alanine carboxypeptidase family protein n=1 Tax=Bacillus sp. 03113 TaxID=2578211 RepID=UPI001142C071|nr:D-alanyl-D-alanine carboxypeptidase family protein [Bacillus sp. 03113]
MKFYKSLIIFLVTVFILLLHLPHKVKASVSVGAKSAILMDQKTGRILFEKDAYEKSRIASITKIMTAIIAIESGKMNDMVKVSEKAVQAEGSSLYLIPGEKIKLKDLVYGLMLRSGNDAAVAIAEHVGGSLDGFVFLMNQKAAEIGMKKTHFANPHGLDDHENHYSTAYDMALLTKYAMINDVYRSIAGSKVYRAPHPTEEWDRVWKNKNRLLTEFYEYSTGGKTGYTKRAKRTLVSTAEKGDMKLIVVTLNDPDDWNDHMALFDMGFNNYRMIQIIPKGKIKDIKNRFYKNKLFVQNSFDYPVTSEETVHFKLKYQLQKPKKRWRRHDEEVPKIVGKAIIYLDNKPVKSIPIYYKHKADHEQPAFMEVYRGIFMSVLGVKENG